MEKRHRFACRWSERIDVGRIRQFRGFDGIIGKLNEAGLGPQVNSWLDKGDNVPINADDLTSVLGNEQLIGLAAKLGISMDLVADVLAVHLPMAVDRASPNGVLVNPEPVSYWARLD